jgi:hypothetical protein
MSKRTRHAADLSPPYQDRGRIPEIRRTVLDQENGVSCHTSPNFVFFLIRRQGKAKEREPPTYLSAVWHLMKGPGRTRDGKPSRNTYAWFLNLRDEKIVKATACLHSIACTDFWQRITPTP